MAFQPPGAFRENQARFDNSDEINIAGLFPLFERWLLQLTQKAPFVKQ
jgi:hypothetical protein